MCGIAGIASTKADLDSSSAVARMVAALAHRGPDSHGVQDLGACMLGNARLAIVDLSDRGRQPMSNEDSTRPTCNVQRASATTLKNFARSSLTQRATNFALTTDTEVILHMYEEFGGQCAAKAARHVCLLRSGIRATQKLVLVRDRLGIKLSLLPTHI